MTKQEAAIIMAYTEISMLTGHDFSIFRQYIEEKLKRPVWTHELADKAVWEQIKESSREDFINLCKSLKNGTNELADKAVWEQIKESSFINLCKSLKNGMIQTISCGRVPVLPATKGTKATKMSENFRSAHIVALG